MQIKISLTIANMKDKETGTMRTNIIIQVSRIEKSISCSLF